MKKLTEVEKKRLWEAVRNEFPDDELMQEVHHVRLTHHCLTENLSREERLLVLQVCMKLVVKR